MAIGFIVAAVWIHFSPGGNRYVKYELLVAGISLHSMRFFSMVAQEVFMAIRPPRPWAGTVYDQSWSVDATLRSHVYLWTFLGYVVFLVAAQVLPSLHIFRRAEKQTPLGHHQKRFVASEECGAQDFFLPSSVFQVSSNRS
jgi:hypothetical protein